MQSSGNTPEKTIELREIFAILRKRYSIIISITVLILLITGTMSFFILPPVYEAKTVLLVTEAAPEQYYTYESKEGLEGIMSSISKLPEMTLDTYAGQLRSEAVIERAIKKLNLDKKGYTVGSLATNITVAVMKDTHLIELKVTNTDRVLAAKIANTIAAEFLEFMSAANERQMEKAVQFLEKQESAVGEELKQAQRELQKLGKRPAGEIPPEQLSAAQKEVEQLEELRNLLRTKINEMKIGKSMKFGETRLRIVSSARVPDAPVKPNKAFNMSMALVVGLVVSTGLAFLINYLDNTVKTPEQVEELFGLPVLGQIPVFKQEKPRSRGVDYEQ